MITTAKVELIHKGLGGPYTVRINGTDIECVEDIQLVNDGKVHKVHMTLIVDNYTLRKEEYTPEEKVLNKFARGGVIKGRHLALVGE